MRNRDREKYADKPVVFIAVNSGNPKSSVEGYAKSTGFEWPILVDENRAVEKAYGTSISLSNIYQWFVVDPEGQVTGYGGSADQALAAVDRLLPRAKFLFDGIEIPAKLRASAKAIEMGAYVPHVAAVASLAKRDEAAAAMFGKLTPMAESMLEGAKASEEAGKKLSAYRAYEKVALWFRKTDYEKTAKDALGRLKKDKDVRTELTAQKVLDQVKRLLATGKERDRQRAAAMIQVIEKKYEGTETAAEAARLK